MLAHLHKFWEMFKHIVKSILFIFVTTCPSYPPVWISIRRGGRQRIYNCSATTSVYHRVDQKDDNVLSDASGYSS